MTIDIKKIHDKLYEAKSDFTAYTFDVNIKTDLIVDVTGNPDELQIVAWNANEELIIQEGKFLSAISSLRDAWNRATDEAYGLQWRAEQAYIKQHLRAAKANNEQQIEEIEKTR